MLERVMIVTGESSGELYGSLLAAALKERNPGIRLSGVGGERMRAAGVELLSGIAGVFGIVEAVGAYRRVRETFRRVCAALRSFRPQVLVLIDYPDFNMRVAREAKREGIRILYYVSPQVWAWRGKRVRALRDFVDRMAVLFPFEERLYTEAGVPCEFVGHPVMDEIGERLKGAGYGIGDIGKPELRRAFREGAGMDPERPVAVLMPGSRPHEIGKLLPLMEGVVVDMGKRYPGYQVAVPVAPNLDGAAVSAMRERLERTGHPALFFTSDAVGALLSADAAVIASGTSTLQAALLGVPMVVVYKLSPLTYCIGRLLVRVRHISLANILLDKSVADDSGIRVRELLQGDAEEGSVMEELGRIVDNASCREEMQAQLEKVRRLFLGKRASLRTAELVEELSGR
ncbi:MAG: lipid-A-disaccharide synthase [Thermodesulfovibrionales bacterium]